MALRIVTAVARVKDTGIASADVLRAQVRLPPYAHRLVGHDLNIGTNPQVSAIHRQLDIAPGFPGAALTEAQHLARFNDCLAYAPLPVAAAQNGTLMQALAALEHIPDARVLATYLVAG